MLEHSPHQHDTLNDITAMVAKGKYTPDKVVASVSFGFWTYMFTKVPFRIGGQSILQIFTGRQTGLGQKAIFKELQQKRKHADITDLSVAINEIVNEHLEVDGEGTMAAESRRFDISGIDFELLRREFAKSKEKNLVLKDIQELLQERIAQMLAQNPSRINFYEKYQEIIHDYNQEQNRATIEKTFTELMKLSHELTEEEKRYIREGFDNDEQLSMYDVLMKDDLSKEDIKKLKTVAKDLLETIKAQLSTMDHPFDKQETKASIIITIRDILWKELPESYSDESINYYRDAVYNYVSQHYGSVA